MQIDVLSRWLSLNLFLSLKRCSAARLSRAKAPPEELRLDFCTHFRPHARGHEITGRFLPQIILQCNISAFFSVL